MNGDVQGVFFRDSIRRWADEREVSGWVCNRPDGTVEAAFEGIEPQVRRLIELIEEGPPNARVDGVEVTEEETSGLDGFEVR